MPDQFPKLSLDGPRDLDHVFDKVTKHAAKVVTLEFGKELKSDAILAQTVSKAVDVWAATARIKVESNLLFNGLSLHEYSKQTKGIEPFDEDLSRRVQSLADKSDQLTEKVIGYRKTLPSRRAVAMQRRAEVVRLLEEKKEQQRRRAEKQREKVCPSDIKVDLQRKQEVKRTLQQSVRDITGLQVSILEQATSASEQARLVKRLRTMPP